MLILFVGSDVDWCFVCLDVFTLFRCGFSCLLFIWDCVVYLLIVCFRVDLVVVCIGLAVVFVLFGLVVVG